MNRMTSAAGGVEFTSSEIAPPADVAEQLAGSIEPEVTEVDPDAGVETPVIADDAGTDVGGLSTSITARGPVEANVEGDTKSRKSKAPKAKAPKPAKEKKVKAPKVADAADFSVPVNVAVDFYRGVTKVRDAEQHARAFIEKNFDAPNASYLYVQRWRDGIAVEMQEGGGRAYLPEVLAALDENPDMLCALPMPNRVLQVRLDAETQSLEAMALTAGQKPVEGTFTALPTVKMIPFDRRGSKVFFIGLALLAASMIALMFSMASLFLDTKGWAIPHVQQTDVSALPSAQTPKIKAALAAGECIAKMEYAGGQWNIVTGWNDGSGVCTSQRPATTEVTVPTPGDVSVVDTTGAAPAPPVPPAPAPGGVPQPPKL